MIRRLKLAYSLYNFFHRKPLEHNVEAYEKLGIKKSYFSTVSSADFEGKKPAPVKEADNGVSPAHTRLYGKLDQATRKEIDQFHEQGYSVLRSFVDGDTADLINREIENLMASGELEITYGNKLMFAIRKSELLSQFWNDEEMLELLSSLLNGRARLFQSINFLYGSQQKTHSDSIHMTTFPLGGLLGVWLALEDIELDNGPLHYYPGSHTMPYYLNTEYGNEGDWLMTGKKTYGDYETMIAEKVAGTTFEKKVFTAKKGDLFIWHANLLHGGEPHLNRDKTRKSMVLHYFDVNRVCYHEITQRPALFL